MFPVVFFYLGALCTGQDLLLLLQVSGDDHGHVDRIFLEPVLWKQTQVSAQTAPQGLQRLKLSSSDLQVPLDLADVVLQQEVVLQGEAAVLVVQLGQEVVEADGGQRVLHGHRVPEGGRSCLVFGDLWWLVKKETGLDFSPVDAFDPPAQVLSDIHGEGVVVQLVHLLQVLTVQHLKLAPLRHLLENKSSFIIIIIIV